jgi:putative transposase
MGRIARVIAVGVPHHITQRGNGRRAVFHVEEDRTVYLQLLREYGERYAVRWWGYCLMSNHVHLVAVPMKENALANALRRAHSDYARYANVKLRTSGHFWQNRYYSCPLDRIHQWTALAYVERNPVRAGMVSRAEDYVWSSAPMRLSGSDASEFLDLAQWRRCYSPERWRDILATGVGEEAEWERIREATRTGRPLGSPDFVRDVGVGLGRVLERRKAGRPPKNVEDKVGADYVMTNGNGK